MDSDQTMTLAVMLIVVGAQVAKNIRAWTSTRTLTYVVVACVFIAATIKLSIYFALVRIVWDTLIDAFDLFLRATGAHKLGKLDIPILSNIIDKVTHDDEQPQARPKPDPVPARTVSDHGWRRDDLHQ
jgi:hypothetical protein